MYSRLSDLAGKIRAADLSLPMFKMVKQVFSPGALQGSIIFCRREIIIAKQVQEPVMISVLIEFRV
jgi:hypothetical protein